jgi:hypothetical protein
VIAAQTRITSWIAVPVSSEPAGSDAGRVQLPQGEARL